MPKTNNTIWVYGAGGHARVVMDAATSAGLELIGLVDDGFPTGTIVEGTVVLGGRSVFEAPHALAGSGGVIAIGDNELREQISQLCLAAALPLAVVQHAAAVVSPRASVAAGAMILAGAIINPAARVGRGAIINTGAIIEHDVDIGDYAHVSPGARLGGGARVGARTHLGLGATVLPRVQIGDDCVIGAGAVVTRDIPSGVVAFGVPARAQRAKR